MFSSDMRIIKDAKISRDPVIIAMHEFEELDVSTLLRDESINETADELGDPMGVQISEVDSFNGLNAQPELSPPEKAMQEAKVRSEMMLTAAVQEISKMKAQAAEEAESLKAQAIEKGKRQGLEEARRQLAEQQKQATERSNAMVTAALQEARQIVLGAEQQIIELVLAVSRKVIYDEMDGRPDIILGIVRRALERVKDQNQINIHVSLDDYERILQARNVLQGIVGAEQTLTVTADTVLGQGGCVIETSFGTVEAGVDSQLESIRKALQDIMP